MTASITVDTSAIVDGEIIDAADITLPIGQLKTSIDDVLNGIQAFDRISFGAAEALTISSGVISPTKTHVVVDTEGLSSTDNLDTINNGAQGRWIAIRSADNSRSVILKHGTGNIRTSTGQDCVLNSTNMWALLLHDGTNWLATLMSTLNALQINTSRTVLGSNLSSVTISSIPVTYKHLMLILEMRTDFASTIDNIIMRFNADATAGNYYSQNQNSSGASVLTGEVLGTLAGINVPCATGSTALAGNGHAVIIIKDYASTTMRRTVTFHCYSHGANSSGGLRLSVGGGDWTNTTAAINSITLLPSNGSNILTNSAYTLYGFN